MSFTIVQEDGGEVQYHTKCPYNYHEDLHEDLRTFEIMVDAYLIRSDQLTEEAQEFAKELCVGIERMYEKLQKYKECELNDLAKGLRRGE